MPGFSSDAPDRDHDAGAVAQTVIDVNLTGQFLCCQRRDQAEFVRSAVRGPSVSRALGKIICMSSVHEKIIPWGGHVNYAASKGGIMLMMQSAGAGIRRPEDPHQLDRARSDQDADQP